MAQLTPPSPTYGPQALLHVLMNKKKLLQQQNRCYYNKIQILLKQKYRYYLNNPARPITAKTNLLTRNLTQSLTGPHMETKPGGLGKYFLFVSRLIKRYTEVLHIVFRFSNYQNQYQMFPLRYRPTKKATIQKKFGSFDSKSIIIRFRGRNKTNCKNNNEI